MRTLVVTGVILLGFLFLGQIRLGCTASYQQDGLALWFRFGAMTFKIFPRSGKREKKKELNENRAKTEEAVSGKPQQRGGRLEYVKKLLPVVLEAAGQFKRKLRVEHLELELIIGGTDPADLAMTYGWANGVLGAIWIPLTESFRVEEGRAQILMDPETSTSALYGRVSMSLKIGQICRLGLYFGTKALRTAMAVRREEKGKQVRKAA